MLQNLKSPQKTLEQWPLRSRWPTSQFLQKNVFFVFLQVHNNQKKNNILNIFQYSNNFYNYDVVLTMISEFPPVFISLHPFLYYFQTILNKLKLNALNA